MIRAATLRVFLGVLLGCVSSAYAEPPSSPESTPSTKPPESPLWSGCAVVELRGSVRAMQCPDVVMRFSRVGVLSGERGLAFALTVRADEPAPPTQWLKVGSRRVPFAFKAGGAASNYVSAPIDEALMVCVGDEATLSERCEPRVRWVAEHGLPPGISFPPAKMEFMGVSLQVPKGCKLVGTERITCGAVSLDWRAGIPPTDPFRVTEAAYRAAGFTIVTSEPTSCMLSGVAGEGKTIGMKDARGSYRILACLAHDRGVRGIAVCLGIPKKMGKKFPSPCDQVFGKAP